MEFIPFCSLVSSLKPGWEVLNRGERTMQRQYDTEGARSEY